MFRGSVKGTGYPFHWPVSHSLPLPCVTVCRYFSNGLYHQTFSLHFKNIYRHIAYERTPTTVQSIWNVMAHGDAREGNWRGNWQMEWIACTLHTTAEHGVSSITTADAHTSAASSRLNWRPCRFKCTRPFRRKTKSCFCACAITFQTQSTWFWKACNAAWPFRGRPSSGHAVATPAMHTAIKLPVPQYIHSWQDTLFYN